jgi:hypothetical protein
MGLPLVKVKDMKLAESVEDFPVAFPLHYQ